MKLGIMQPYFFPYIGYFDLIYQTDFWIVFDTPQYIRHGWVNRNRILHPSNGWQYIIVPTIRHDQKTAIRDINISEESNWRDKLLRQLHHYKKKAPFYNEVLELVSKCLTDSGSSLSKLNVKCLEEVCFFLGIPFKYNILSEVNMNLGLVEEAGDWALRIAEAFSASEYLNPPGGAHLFDPFKFELAGIKLSIQKPMDLHYECDGYIFEQNLSIIDVMMWNSPDVIRQYLITR